MLTIIAKKKGFELKKNYLNTFYKNKKDNLFNIKENGVFPLMFYKQLL